MNDKDITKLAAKLTESLATKEDLQQLRVDLKGDVTELKGDIKRLEGKIDDLDQKADTILQFAEAIDETVDDYEKRLRKIEFIPAIAHEIKKR